MCLICLFLALSHKPSHRQGLSVTGSRKVFRVAHLQSQAIRLPYLISPHQEQGGAQPSSSISQQSGLGNNHQVHPCFLNKSQPSSGVVSGE